MRRPFTISHATASGLTLAALRWQLHKGQCVRVLQGVYLDGGAPPTPIERALALLVVTNGVASGTLAGHLLGLDAMPLRPPFVTVPANGPERPGVRQRDLSAERVITVNGYRCTDAIQTLCDLAVQVSDELWEQALESALRQCLLTIPDLEAAIVGGRKGNKRIRRVLRRRPPNAPPTESLLETLMVQLIRNVALPDPQRQVNVWDECGGFVARVDLAWPEQQIFIELDGRHHNDQLLHDARRETAVVAATGWIPARFTWDEVKFHPRATGRRLQQLFAVAVRR